MNAIKLNNGYLYDTSGLSMYPYFSKENYQISNKFFEKNKFDLESDYFCDFHNNFLSIFFNATEKEKKAISNKIINIITKEISANKILNKEVAYWILFFGDEKGCKNFKFNIATKKIGKTKHFVNKKYELERDEFDLGIRKIVKKINMFFLTEYNNKTN